MKIQDAESRTGLDRATIRFYEKENILTPERSENGYRNYSDADVELLLKIKLLRKLGVNIPTIKALQQGEENLSEVLTQQIQILEQQIQNDTRAKTVCIQMQNDGAQYSTLDSEAYLQRLNLPQENAGFQENVKKEIHPVRRFIARDIDLVLIGALTRVLLIMVFRIRINSELLSLLILISAYVIALPLEALMLRFWGTTPGKWVMGIRLEDPNGGKLSFADAFTRTWHVTFVGLGLHIPIYTQICLWRSYCDETEGKGTYWDEEAEIHYRDIKFYNVLAMIALLAAAIFLAVSSAKDLMLPKYRPENLTVKKFAANYRYYNEMFGYDSMVLDKDGTWIWGYDNGYVIDQGNNRPDFTYTYNSNGGIHSISFRSGWQNEDMFINALPRQTLYTVVASRPGAGSEDLERIDALLQTEFAQKLQAGGTHSGSFKIHDVVFDWEASLPSGEYYYVNGMLFHPDDGEVDNYENQNTPNFTGFTITIG